MTQAVPLVSQEIDHLRYRFTGGYGQVEVGGPFAGAEFHESRCLPSRISLFYPVANSIDVSTDYWRRGESHPMSAGMRVNGGERRNLGTPGWVYSLSPHTVRFEKTINGIACALSYEFCESQPALVFRMIFRNTTRSDAAIEAYTHLRLSLRSCQTYARFDTALMQYDPHGDAVVARFDAPELDSAACFVMNAGARPSMIEGNASDLDIGDDGSSRWFSTGEFPEGPDARVSERAVPAAAFLYQLTVLPDDSIEIVQIIGSCGQDEVRPTADVLAREWEREVRASDERVRAYALGAGRIVTGDPVLDRTADWASGILAANAHYLDGRIVPMPCPAEYNFFFTHDLLLTDLGAVHRDTERVRRDLLYLRSLAKDSVIPHAYYWRDGRFVTEQCTPDNWNHLWFVIVAGSYVRHSLDTATAGMLYPLLTKSISEVLRQRKPDNLMYGYRPDWWDIGHIEGPRAFLTILSIRALREYVSLSARLGRGPAGLLRLESMAAVMQRALVDQLWDRQREYLIDRNEGKDDTHYYMGPLLATAFGLLDSSHAAVLVRTAERKLLDRNLGVRTVAPPDFHTTEAIAYYKFAGEEAGRPFYYINGGVWPQGNAFYAVSLVRLGRVEEALSFVKRTMTLDGIAGTPLGHPAMFEYRCSDTAEAAYGMIDKPSFLWAGGFTLYTLYRIFGIDEDEWNISLGGNRPRTSTEVTLSLAFGSRKEVSIRPGAHTTANIIAGGKALPTVILPLSLRPARSITVTPAAAGQPVLLNANAILHAVDAAARHDALSIAVSSYAGHPTVLHVSGGRAPSTVTVNGKTSASYSSTAVEGSRVITEIRFLASAGHDTVTVNY
ncbi:MAG: hypothetical protein AB1428_02820 [Bacteroidota bacterium]